MRDRDSLLDAIVADLRAGPDDADEFDVAALVDAIRAATGSYQTPPADRYWRLVYGHHRESLLVDAVTRAHIAVADLRPHITVNESDEQLILRADTGAAVTIQWTAAGVDSGLRYVHTDHSGAEVSAGRLSSPAAVDGLVSVLQSGRPT
ncbi:hypothetical protein [Gordonia sp. NPDC003376]